MAQGEPQMSKTPDGKLRVTLAGEWRLDSALHSPGGVRDKIESSPDVSRVAFDTGVLSGWDSGLLTFLLEVINICSKRNVQVNREGLPPGGNRLLNLATAVPERKGARRGAERIHFLVRTGERVSHVR